MRETAYRQALLWSEKKRKKRGPKRKKDALVAHGSRPELAEKDVCHVTIKLIPGMDSLRRGQPHQEVRSAIDRVNKKGLIQIVEFSIQSNHVHLLIEAKNSADLSKGMASFSTGLGMRLNRIWNRVKQGSVFMDRFHLEVISSPTQMRRALTYVLRNDVHHGMTLGELDPCSSAPYFNGWSDGPKLVETAWPPRINARPKKWLMTAGWKRGGGRGERLLSVRSKPRLARGVRVQAVTA